MNTIGCVREPRARVGYGHGVVHLLATIHRHNNLGGSCVQQFLAQSRLGALLELGRGVQILVVDLDQAVDRLRELIDGGGSSGNE